MSDTQASNRLTLPPGFSATLLSIVQGSPEGVSEHAVLKQLAERYPESLFAETDALRDPLKLFRVHFLLFHSLYLLSDELRAGGNQLHINPRGIRLELLPVAEPGLERADPLRKYYLDLEQWRTTQREDVEALLATFWRGIQLPDAEVAEAHEVFGLKAPVGPSSVRRRYRELVALHHPDRGGVTETAQRINEAYIILKRYYGAS
jgi:hypothetical protein